ncbi:MAG TPA: iron-sulfur cluster carrier protein MrpORP [Candidatus Krumholzibacterium sp.]|nr:iron-sulfur cluster carrier protein MrpORP [Candidatus Krumholzibacterium sp.]
MKDPKDEARLASRLAKIRHKVLVLSGKGGVGKSTIAVNLAVALATAGKKVGLIDIDLHGPSVPKMLGIEDMPVGGTEDSIKPFMIGDNLLVMSVGFLLRNRDEAVIWRGPLKMSVIKQFLADVEWGELDYIVVDSPPGTGDEPLSIAQLIPDADGAVIVTTPQSLAVQDVRKCVTFCRQLKLPVIGVIENMSGFVCPHCNEKTDFFGKGGGEEMAADMGIPFMGSVPLDPGVVTAGDSGRPFVLSSPETETGRIFAALAAPILALDTKDRRRDAGGTGKAAGKGEKMKIRIALPVDENSVSDHFGHAEKFLVFGVDRENNTVSGPEELKPPEHDTGVVPEWLAGEDIDLVIAGGIGRKAIEILAGHGIGVMTGIEVRDPAEAVRAYLAGGLRQGGSPCGGHEGGCGGQGGCGGHQH